MKKIKKIKRGSSVGNAAKQFAESSTKANDARKQRAVNPDLLVPTGSTTFNLECSGRVEGA